MKLDFEKGTSVWKACGAVLNGQQWLIGGDPDRRQVSPCQGLIDSDLQVKIGKYNDSNLDKPDRWMQCQKD